MAIAMLVATSSLSNAAIFTQFDPGYSGAKGIYIEGKIIPGDVETFKKLLSECCNGTHVLVSLHSGGGDARTGYYIGTLISTLYILRRVADGFYESLQQDCGDFYVFRV
jgi:hypothetical protein